MLKLSSLRNRALLPLMTVALAVACAAGPEISTNRDPAADFSAFRTFGFMQPLGTDSASARTPLSGWLIASTTRQLKSQGLQSVGSNPDLLVNFFSGIRTTTSSRSSASFTPALRNYGGWAGSPLSKLTTASISEGTLIVDIVDRRSNQLVWQGRAEERFTEAMEDDLPGTVDRLVAQLFSDFP